MEIIRKKIILALVLALFILTFLVWRECQDFKDFIKLSSVNIPLHLEDLIHTDKGGDPLFVRIFHNKVVDTSLIILRKYLYFYDIRFGVNFFSLVGYFGILCGLYYSFVGKRSKGLVLYIIFLLLLPLVQIIIEPKLNFLTRLAFLQLPYLSLALYGVWRFLDSRRIRYFIIIVLFIINVWWLLVMSSEITNYCIGVSHSLQ